MDVSILLSKAHQDNYDTQVESLLLEERSLIYSLNLATRIIFVFSKLHTYRQIVNSSYVPHLPQISVFRMEINRTTEQIINSNSMDFSCNHHLLIFYTNPRSIINKLQQFQSLMYSKSFDIIIALTETWLTDSIFDNEFYLTIMQVFVKIASFVVAVNYLQ